MNWRILRSACQLRRISLSSLTFYSSTSSPKSATLDSPCASQSEQNAMSDDELDPAFAEFDSHSPHSDDFGDSSLGFNLGEEFGQPIGNGLDFELDNGGEASGEAGGEEHGSPLQSEASTPRRRTPKSNTPINPAARMSLAFELASASDGGNGRGRDLLTELGFEEEEDEEDLGSRSSEEDQSYDIVRGGSLQLGEPLFDSTRSPSESSLNKTRQLNGTYKLSSRSSTTRLSTSSPPDPTSVSPATEPDICSFDEDELETTFQETASSLEESISSTATFITNLQRNLYGSPSSIPLGISPNSNGFDPRLSSSTLPLPNHLSIPFPSPNPTGGVSSPPSYVDRQPLVEKAASTFVKSLYSTTKQREMQVRDITELDRLFARNEIGWATVLSELEPIPVEFDDNSDEDSEGGRPESTSTSSSPPASTLDAISPSHPPSHVLSQNTNGGRRLHLDLYRTISTEFHHLRILTTALLDTFASMSDIVQVQSALAQEASRKLRSSKTQIVTVRDELVNLDRSEEFVRVFVERRSPGGKTRDYAKEAREIMNGVEEELKIASREASNMLCFRA